MKRNKLDLHEIVIVVLAIFSVMIFSSAGFCSERPNWINIALSGSPRTFKPWEINDAVSSSVFQNNVYECLFRYGENRQVIEPCLATGWSVKDAGRVWIFELRQDVHFHDGSVMTAEDVVESFKRTHRFTGQIEAIGKNRVKVSFTEKMANFLESVTQVYYSIVRVSGDGRVIGTGPFEVTDWEPERKIVLRPFRQYWGGTQKIDGATFYCSVDSLDAVKRIESGAVDIIDIVPPEFVSRLQDNPDIEVSVRRGVNISFVLLNDSNPPLDNLEFRKALNMAIDKKNLIRDIYKGEAVPCKGLLPPALGGMAGDTDFQEEEYNMSEARNIIHRYVGEKSRVFKMVGLPFPRPYCPNPQGMARIIAGYLRSAGINIRYYPTRSFDDFDKYLKSGDYDMVIAGWIIDSNDPDDFFTPIFGIGEVASDFGQVWKTPEFESLILRARETISLKSRWQLYMKAEDLFYKDMPWILIAYPNLIGAYRRTVKGFAISPTGEMRLLGVEKTQ